jgi:CheY-like chemotaxis protein
MKTKVHVVDDDRQTCELIQSVLSGAGMEVSYSTEAAAAALRLHTEKMDLLFLDLHMPDAPRFGLLHSLRAQGINRKTPVVMITGDQDPSVLAQGFQNGANYFLFKPIELNRLMRLIRASEVAVYRERRRFQRISVDRRAAVILQGRRIEGKTLDLSLGGMMFRGESVAPAGENVSVELHLGPGALRVRAAARVARTLEDGCMGIEFLRLQTPDAEKLQQFLLPFILEPEAPAASGPAAEPKTLSPLPSRQTRNALASR